MLVAAEATIEQRRIRLRSKGKLSCPDRTVSLRRPREQAPPSPCPIERRSAKSPRAHANETPAPGDLDMTTDTLYPPVGARHAIDDEALDQLFRAARTHNDWLDRPPPR